MSRWVRGLIAGAVVGAAMALLIHFEQPTGCSIRHPASGGTVTFCGHRGDLTSILIPLTLIGGAFGGAIGLLIERRRAA